MKKLGPWHQLSCDLVYENPWIKVEHHCVKTPSDTDGIYGKVAFKNTAVGIVPLDGEGNTYLVRQYRYPLEEYSWEIPEGGCPDAGQEFATAVRELREETGLTAKSWFHLMHLHLSNSVTNERAEVFVAIDLTAGEVELDVTEDIEVLQLPLYEAINMALDGRISDAISVAALMKLRILLTDCGGDLSQLASMLAVRSD